MKLVSWNVNSLRARLPRVLELLAEHAPDVACLQETKVAADTFPHEVLAAVGYRAVDRSEGRWNGVAVLAREGLAIGEVVRELPGEPDPEEARWLEVEVDGLRVATLYVHNGREPTHPMFGLKLRFLDAVRDRVAELAPVQPLVVAGDVNVAPEDRDVWDPAAFVGATHVTPEERHALAAILASGLRDAYRDAEPDAVGFTWWDYRMGAFRRGMGMRIDAALVSRQLEVRSCQVDTSYRRVNRAGDKPSDHAPLVVDLEVREAPPQTQPGQRPTSSKRWDSMA
jgi:exodeoxyribonuclease III